jgi:ABC-type antimicrobial peptide transport system permease subunit
MPFSRANLLIRNLTHFRAANVAVALGMAVATAVLTGALMVGDSVRASLRALAEARLDFVDHALVMPRFVPQSLANRIADHPDFKQRFESITPGITLRGGAATADDKNRTAGVQITALADRHSVPANEAVINSELGDSLSIEFGEDPGRTALRFNLPAPDEAPKDATLARRGRGENILSLTVSRVHRKSADGGFLAAFNLAGGQRLPRNAWVNLRQLQDDLDRPDQINLLLADARPGHTAPDDAAALTRIIQQVATLQDYGLQPVPSADKSQVALHSAATYIHPAIVDAAETLAKEQNVPLQKASVYLINYVHKTSGPGEGQKTIHYAIAAGIDQIDGQPLGELDVAVNQWTAERLGLKVGDTISLEYYIRKANGDLEQVWSDEAFTVAKILPMTGLGADKSLTPDYKGLTDADTISRWNPPEGLIIDKKLVTREDELYWSNYKAAPKLFVNLNTAGRLWGTAFGDVTSLRVPADKEAAFGKELARRIDPASLGLSFAPIRDQQLHAASGGTDFSQLFIGFSFFLLVAAMLLVAMLFRLSVEQRARQLGLLSACGFSPRQLRNLSLKEGFVLAILGADLGLALAVAYTALMIHGLRTWWVDAIGTTALRLHISPLTLVIGMVAGIVVAMLAVMWSVRRISKSQPSALLAGALTTSANRLARPARKTLFAAGGVAIVAALLFAAGAMGRLNANAAYLGGGALLLTSALLFTFARLRPLPPSSILHPLSSFSLATRNATRNRTRSLGCVALIALATFTLVTVSSMESAAPTDTWKKDSGAGGYNLLLQADIPLLGDLNTPSGRKVLGVADTNSHLWSKAAFANLRSWAGQDISCLNITRPGQPTILAVPDGFTEQKRFTFAKRSKPVDNEWILLNEPQADGSIPVIADDESATYILHLGVGDTMELTDAAGRKQKLKLVATLKGSIFQSEMLMGESNFLKLFPAQAGYQTVLVETSPENQGAVAKLLSNELGEYSVAVDTTAARLHAYHQVANTYLSTFRVLGSLGLMLGTIGLAVVLVRNLVERRAELALLGALGFRRKARTKLVLIENSALLLAGLLIGAVCALAGVIPNTLITARKINVTELAIALGLVLVVGLASLVVATRIAGRKVTPAALRAE